MMDKRECSRRRSGGKHTFTLVPLAIALSFLSLSLLILSVVLAIYNGFFRVHDSFVGNSTEQRAPVP